MNFIEAMDFVEGQHCFPTRLEDFHAKRFIELARLSHTFSRLPKIVVVSGSCGKASTARFLAFMLREEGFRVGVGTKPPLLETAAGNRERYQLFDAKGEHWISPELFEQIVRPLPQLLQNLPKELGEAAPYELRAWILLQAFCEWEVDYGIVEANIGLRNDPAGALPAELTLITPIGTDHSQLLEAPQEWQYLGEAAGPLWHKLSKIPSKRVVVGHQPMISPKALDQLIDRLGPRYGRDFFIEDAQSGLWGSSAELRANELNCTLQLDCLGSFQLENAALAAVAFKELYPRASLSSILNGARKQQVPGRLQVVGLKPLELLCVATSKQKLQAMFSSLDSLWDGYQQKMVVVFSLLDRAHDKDKVLEVIARHPRLRALVATSGKYQDGSSDLVPQDMAAILKEKAPALEVVGEPEPGKAIALARSLRQPSDLTIFLGNGVAAFWVESVSRILG